MFTAQNQSSLDSERDIMRRCCLGRKESEALPFARTASLFLVCGSLWLVGPTHAQAPQRITAKFDDWTVTCNAPPDSVKSCEIVQSQMATAQRDEVGQITISRSDKNQSFKIYFQVPSNVSLQAGIKFTPADKVPQITALFRWCLPSRCLADADLPAAALNQLRTLTEPGHEEYNDAGQHKVSLSVSFKGLAPALDWMEKQ
jgi:invasion protein IalB